MAVASSSGDIENNGAVENRERARRRKAAAIPAAPFMANVNADVKRSPHASKWRATDLGRWDLLPEAVDRTLHRIVPRDAPHLCVASPRVTGI